MRELIYKQTKQQTASKYLKTLAPTSDEQIPNGRIDKFSNITAKNHWKLLSVILTQKGAKG